MVEVPNVVRGFNGVLARAGRCMLGRRFPGRVINHPLALKLLPDQLDVPVVGSTRVRLRTAEPFQRALISNPLNIERPTPDVLSSWVSRATRFFDIGANVGYYSYVALEASSTVAVHAFEPHPVLVGQLRETVERNHLDRLDVVASGLSDAVGVARLHVADRGGFEWGTLGDHPDWGGGDYGIDVPITTFDRWLEERQIVLPSSPEWVAKIDVEGWEPHVLRGMRTALEGRAFRAITIELNAFTLEFCATSVDEVKKVMTGYGFSEELHISPDNQNGFFVLP
jgi:FkbM family methyltransferase